MARKCPICKKGAKMAAKRIKLRGKYNPTTKRKQFPNLQWVKIPLEIQKEPFKKFAGKRILACTRCIKRLLKKE